MNTTNVPMDDTTPTIFKTYPYFLDHSVQFRSLPHNLQIFTLSCSSLPITFIFHFPHMCKPCAVGSLPLPLCLHQSPRWHVLLWLWIWRDVNQCRCSLNIITSYGRWTISFFAFTHLAFVAATLNIAITNNSSANKTKKIYFSKIHYHLPCFL